MADYQHVARLFAFFPLSRFCGFYALGAFMGNNFAFFGVKAGALFS